jgi:N6-L-threonylcarbamoyladenine synthase
MLRSGDFNFSFAGLKTAVLTLVRDKAETREDFKANVARAFQDALVAVLTQKSLSALKHAGMKRLVVAGGVGANLALRQTLNREAARRGFQVYYPELEFCTDNGAMIAFAGAMRLQAGARARPAGIFVARPRWPLSELMEV